MVFDNDLIDGQVNSKGSFRINGGFEHRIRDNLAFYAGSSNVPSSLEETAETFGQDFWSYFAGGKLFSKYFETSVGLFYSVGKGKGNLGT